MEIFLLYLVVALFLGVATRIGTVSLDKSMFVLTIPVEFFFFTEAFSLSSCMCNVMTFCIMIYLPSTIMQQVVASVILEVCKFRLFSEENASVQSCCLSLQPHE